MQRALFAALAGLTIALAASGGAYAASSRPALHSSKAAAVVFKSAFASTGLKGWKERLGAKAWKVSKKGIVSFDGSTTGELIAPYTKSLHDFRVQATIKDTGQQTGLFGVEVHGTSQGFGTLAGYVFSSIPQASEPLLIWGFQPNGGFDSTGGNTITLSSGFNTFRLDVHGNDCTLSINGQVMIQFPVTNGSTGTKVGFWSAGEAMQVKSFTVTKLGSASALPALPPVQDINIGSTDVPSLDWQGDHFYTNAEFARVHSISLDAVTAQGRLLGHESDYLAGTPPTTGAYGVFAYVTAYTSSGNAQTALAGDWAAAQKALSSNTNYTAADVTGLGDVAHVTTYDFSETVYGGASIPATEVDVFFSQGSYENVVSVDFIKGTVAAADEVTQAEAYARIVAQRAAAH